MATFYKWGGIYNFLVSSFFMMLHTKNITAAYAHPHTPSFVESKKILKLYYAPGDLAFHLTICGITYVPYSWSCLNYQIILVIS